VDEIAATGPLDLGPRVLSEPAPPGPGASAQVIGHLKHVITAAEKMNVPLVIPSWAATALETRTRTGRPPRGLADIVKFAQDHGRKITLENCPMLFSYDEWPGATTSPLHAHVATDPGEVGRHDRAQLRPSHLILQMIDMRRFLKEFGPHVLHFQAKDLMIDRDGLYERGIMSMGMGWQIPRIPGLGEVDWSVVFGALSTGLRGRTASSSTRTAGSRGPTKRSSRASLSLATFLRPYVK